MRLILPYPRRSQSPLARIATAVVGVVFLGILIVLGALALAVLLAGGFIGLIWYRWHLHRLRKQAAQATEDARRQQGEGVIEGEYTVVEEQSRRGS